LAIRIEQVAELPRPRRACLDARRVPARPRSLDAEGALLDDALPPRPISQVVRIGIDLLLRNRRLRPVEVPRAVRARRHAVPASDAPVVVDDHDAVALRPRGAGGADLRARSVAAMLAPYGHVEVAILRNRFRLVVRIRVRQVDALLLLHREHANPMQLGLARLVVLRRAGVNAAAA